MALWNLRTLGATLVVANRYSTLNKPASAARPAVTKIGGNCGSLAGPTARRVIGNVIAKITTPNRPSQRPLRSSWALGFMRFSEGNFY